MSKAMPPLTARGLQATLVEELNELFKNDRFKTPYFISEEELAALEPEDQDEETPAGQSNRKYWAQMQRDTNQHRMAAPRAYAQDFPRQVLESPLPPKDVDASEPREYPQAETDDPFPYILVRLDSGGVSDYTKPHVINVVLLVGIFDDDPANQGHMAVMEIIERILRRFLERTAVGAYRLVAREQLSESAVSWYLQEESSYPYYFGAVDLSFEAPAPQPTGWEELV